MQTVGIVGVGLIGASFGLALRKSGFSGEIIGVSSEPALAAGLACGAISSSATLPAAAERADLLYLAQTVDRILQTIPELAPALRPGALVTDAGSTKKQIVACALAHLPAGSFLGGHPLAGKEKRGPEAADAELFRDRPYVLTPVGAASPEASALREALASFGAVVVEMSPEEHDAALALTSHLPQLASTALAATLQRSANPHAARIFGNGLLDMTRLALSSADLWRSILVTNRSEVSKAIDSYIEILQQLKRTLGEREMTNTFEEGALLARSIRKLPLTK